MLRAALQVLAVAGALLGSAGLNAVPAVAGQPAGLQAVSTGSAAADFVVKGQVQRRLHLGIPDLEKLPRVEERVSFRGMHGEETATYVGALLWDLLGKAGTYHPSKPRDRVATVVYVTGRDGYTVALALAEIDPAFEDKRVIIAYRKNGKELPHGGMRLVVPGDKHGGRSVKDVVAVTVH